MNAWLFNTGEIKSIFKSARETDPPTYAITFQDGSHNFLRPNRIYELLSKYNCPVPPEIYAGYLRIIRSH